MCLVDVEKSPKPLPACATPVMEGMKVLTRSERALKFAAKRDGVPADQPPARLPDLRPGRRVRAAGRRRWGTAARSRRYVERKRVVADEATSRPLVRHRHDPLHSLHALRPLHQRDRRHLRTGRHESRREHRDRHLYREDGRVGARRQHHRCLPSRRIDQQAVPVQGPRMGADRARVDRLPRRARFKPVPAHASRRSAARDGSELGQVVVGVGRLVVREAGGHERLGQARPRRHAAAGVPFSVAPPARRPANISSRSGS